MSDEVEQNDNNNGVVERPAKLTRWRPKRWEVVYDQIVALSTLGRSNKELAEIFHYTEQHISNIINCPEASLTRGKLMETLNKGAIGKIEADFEVMAVQAKKRLAQVLFDDDLMTRSPFAVVDRGIGLLKGIGKLKSDNDSKVNIGKAIIFSSEDAKVVQDAITKSDKARQLHGGVETTSRVVSEDKDASAA